MGLSISIRYVNQITGEVIEDEDYFDGRQEFAVIREWVGKERYGEFIPLLPHDEDYKLLVSDVEAELYSRYDENPTDFPFTGVGLSRLYQKILLAPSYAAFNWLMEIECDW